MSNASVNIVEVTENTIDTTNKIGIFIKQIDLFKSVDLIVNLYDPNGSVIRVENLKLEGDDYTKWSTDDTYINTYVFNKFNVNPTSDVSNKIGIFIRKLVLFTSAIIVVYFYNLTGSVIRVENLNLMGEDYTNWGSDDTYIQNYVLNKLNLTPALSGEAYTNPSPDNTDVTPDNTDTENTNVTPDNTDVTPDNTVVTPDNTDVTPDNSDTENTNVTPDNTDVTPDNTDVTPDNTDVTPDNTDVTPA